MDFDEARAQYGTLVRVDLDGRSFAFRDMGADEALALSRAVRRAPELAVTLALAQCEACCVVGAAELPDAIDSAPAAFDLDEGVCGVLMQRANAAAHDEAKAGVRAWRAAERNLAAAAENLLAFKAYNGGPAPAKALAGALLVAEGLECIKATFRLQVGFMKAFSKRG